MTRKELFEEQAADFADRHGFRVPYDGSNDFYDRVDVKASMDGFIAGAEFADRNMLEKACEWLKDMACYYAHWECNGDTYEQEIVFDTEKFIEDFKKAMEE